jgi:hypothetical protein
MGEYLNADVYSFLRESCELVEYYDTKNVKSERAEAFCANIIA